jgi:Ca2+-transporting ATPase
MENGLSSQDAEKKLNEFGYNELPDLSSKTWLDLVRQILKEPMFILLISSSFIYMFIGDYREGVILLSTFSIIIFITYYQNLKTEQALKALRNISSPKATVIRNGIETKIPARELVPDDILILNEGDRIPADACLIVCNNLLVDESLLTGESFPISKSSNQPENIVFGGTLVTQGKAIAKVISTGRNSKFGQIGESLISIKSEQTRLQLEMKILIRRLFLIGVGISIMVFVSTFFTRGNLISSLLNSIATSMAILPEEFPVILTVFLALGSWRLSKNNVLTQTPVAIENLGSTTVLCADKTGTITQNKMEVVSIIFGNQLINKSEFNSRKSIISDLLKVANQASNENSKDPMEHAIKTANDLLNEKEFLVEKNIKHYPLSHQFLAMTNVYETSEINTFQVSAKGSPEAIMELCEVLEDEKSKLLNLVHGLAEKGNRVIAVAKASHKESDLPQTQQGFDFKLLGFLGLEDPIRPEVPTAVNDCQRAGIRVVMITGDFPATARSIANQIGMDTKSKMVSGKELDAMSDEELKLKIHDINIFARVIPTQKLRIVNALKANGEVVAMTGDGVNDAPALKASDIGIAMGKKGTDVAREAAALILLDDNFASIVAAIRSGRRIFDNLQKAMSYVLAIHVPIIGMALIPSFISSLPIFLMPLHIVFLELIIDPICSVAFELEQEEKGIMSRPPRGKNESFFGVKKIRLSLARGLTLFFLVFSTYIFSIFSGCSASETRAISFSTLVLGNVFLILTSLSESRGFFSVFQEKNYAAWLILLVAITMLAIVFIEPNLRVLFHFEVNKTGHFLISIASAVCVILIFEVKKYIRNRKSKSSVK